MKVISVLNQKGGSGKTTIATHIATCLQQKGNSVLLVDSDPQGSSRDWAAMRESGDLPGIGIDRPTLERDLKSLAKKDFVVIDGAPQTADLAISAIKVSNFILIPVQPSPYDIWATSDLVDLVKQRIEITDGKLKAAFVINRAIKGTKIGAEIRKALEEYDLPVLESVIFQRVSYPSSASMGKTVTELEPSSDGAKEIISLTNEILTFLEN